MPRFDWHTDPIDRDTPVTDSYKSTQRVRRFLKAQCGPKFKFDRAFMAWIKDGNLKTMGAVDNGGCGGRVDKTTHMNSILGKAVNPTGV